MKAGYKVYKHWYGERLEPYVYNNATIEHLHRYAITLDLVKGKRVLDIACGEGYGSNLMAAVASHVTGADISVETIEEAKKNYTSANIEFIVSDAAKILCPDASFDVVVSFETIEHHDKHEEMFAEIKRVLKKDGLLIMSSPDKKYYSDETASKNSFHVKELYFSEFKTLVNKYFSCADFYFQNTMKASLLMPEKGSTEPAVFFKGDFKSIDKFDSFIPLYNLVLASDTAVSVLDPSFFNGNDIDALNVKAQLERVERQLITLRNSTSYKLGFFLSKPFRWIKELFGK